MDFSNIYDPNIKSKIVQCIKGYDRDDIEDFVEEEIFGFVVQLNPNSSEYDSVLDRLEEDGMRTFDYQRDEDKAWRFIGMYGEYTEEEVLKKFAGIGEVCIKVDLLHLFQNG